MKITQHLVAITLVLLPGCFAEAGKTGGDDLVAATETTSADDGTSGSGESTGASTSASTSASASASVTTDVGTEESESSAAEEPGSSDDSGDAETSGSSTAGESSTGDESDTWEGFDEHHCDADCPAENRQHDPVSDACWCATPCDITDQDACGWPEVCLSGRCGIPCESSGDCPYNTAPTLVCETMPAAGNPAVSPKACAWFQEGP